LLQKETGRKDVRGILVHGGSRKLRSDVVRTAALMPKIEIVQYQLQVHFAATPAG
jgi:hypothetical protein